MRKSLKNFIPLIIIFISFSTVVYAESTNGLTSPKDLIDTDGVVLELDREANYVFDSDPDQSWYEIDVDTKIANFFFGVLRYLTSATCFVVTFAYTASLFTIFESLIQSVMMPMKETIFDNFFSLTAVIVAVISIIMLERGKQHAFYRTVVCVVSIYAISFMFYAAPMTAVKYTKVVVDSMNNKFIQSSYSVTFKNDLQGRYSDDAVLTLLNNQIWEAFIGRIWTDLEIGEKGLVDPYRDRLINAVPGSMDRENIYKELSEKRTVGRPSRGGAIFFYFLVTTPLLLLVCLLGGVGLAGSAMMMLMILISSLIFLISILPGRGIRILYIWTLKLLTFCAAGFVGLVALTTVLSIHIGWLVYAANSDMGIGTALFLEALMMVILFISRHHLFGFGKSFRRYGAAGIERHFKREANLHRGVPHGARKLGHKAAERAGERVKDGTSAAGRFAQGTVGAAGRFMQQMYSEATSDDSMHMQYGYAFANHSMYARNQAKEKATNAYHGTRDKANDYFDQRKRRQDMASDYLETRFEVEKAAADDVYDKEIEKTGKSIERVYPDFVKSAMDREAAGMNKFTKTQVKDVGLEMDQIEKQGGDPRELFEELKGIMKAQKATEGPRMQQTFRKMRYKQAMDKGSYKTDDGMKDIPKRATDREYGEIYLNNQYHMHKNSADNAAKAQSIAENKTVKPRYDEFTRNVNERVVKGQSKFTEAELNAAEQTMKELRKGGIKPKALLKGMQMEAVEDVLKDYMEVDLNVDSSSVGEDQSEFKASRENEKTSPGVSDQDVKVKAHVDASGGIDHVSTGSEVESKTNVTSEVKHETSSSSDVKVNVSSERNERSDVGGEKTRIQKRPDDFSFSGIEYQDKHSDGSGVKSINMDELLRSMEELAGRVATKHGSGKASEGKRPDTENIKKKIEQNEVKGGSSKDEAQRKSESDSSRRWSKDDRNEFSKLLDKRMKEFKNYSKRDNLTHEIMDDVHDKVMELENQLRDREEDKS